LVANSARNGLRRIGVSTSRAPGFDGDHGLMLVLEHGTKIRGGVIAFGDDVVSVRALGIDDELRGHGHGRRLTEPLEARALVRRAQRMVLGADGEAGGFYERLGYRGKRTLRAKDLPPPGAIRSRLVARAAAVLEHLPDGLRVIERAPVERL
jgi:GNAT superfamily N-acetyltransferase